MIESIGKGNTECYFCKEGRCQALANTMCSGYDKHCSFYKTIYQYREEFDKAILINREKGNCNTCKYMVTPCTCLAGVRADED